MVKRRQPSTIDMLPEDIREKLQELLRDPRVTQLDATARINAVLEAEGHPDRVTKSSVNRYAVRMEEVGAKLRESREVAKMWIGQLGSEPAGEVGKLLNEMVRTLAFRVAMRASEGDDDIDPKDLKALAIAVHRLEMAAEKNAKVEEQIRKKAKEKAAQAVETEGKRIGAGAATIDALRAAIMQELSS
ncbi:MAG: DUF3486 family protein [Pseudomonadota bacterium]